MGNGDEHDDAINERPFLWVLLLLYKQTVKLKGNLKV